MKKELEKEQGTLQNMNGYDKIKSLVNFYIKIIAKIKENKEKWAFK